MNKRMNQELRKDAFKALAETIHDLTSTERRSLLHGLSAELEKGNTMYFDEYGELTSIGCLLGGLMEVLLLDEIISR